MPPKPKLIQLPMAGKIFLCVLAGVYTVYLLGLGHVLYTMIIPGTQSIADHQVGTDTNVVLKHWTPDHMRNAIDADSSALRATSNPTPTSINTVKAARQKGTAPRTGNVDFPISTVGKVFLTSSSGRDMFCSGTAVRSSNRSVVDTAGHCLYLNGEWVQNVIFCPLYDTGNTPYGCWVARDLEVPSDWLEPGETYNYHHDFGMAIVSANNEGTLTDVVGGVGWAYNQSTDQAFYAYGYPAAYPFDGQTRKSCESTTGTRWQYGAGTVVSIPCDMTGGSSGGPWFIKIDGNWYLNGHNDFISSIRPGHMFSPYYDDTWYALYDKAQHA